MPASPPAPLVYHHPSENGSFMPASTPTFIECPSNSLYTYQTSRRPALCSAFTPPTPHRPPRHLRAWVPPPTVSLHLPRCRILLQLSPFRSVPSADYLARTFRHCDFPHLSLSLTSRLDWVNYLLPFRMLIFIGLFFYLC